MLKPPGAHDPQGAGADYDRRVARTHAETRHCVDAASERLEERGDLERQPIQRDDVLCRHDHALGESAVAVEAHGAAKGTAVLVPGAARRAPATPDVGMDADRRSVL